MTVLIFKENDHVNMTKFKFVSTSIVLFLHVLFDQNNNIRNVMRTL